MHNATSRRVLGGLGLLAAILTGCGEPGSANAGGPRSARAGSRGDPAGAIRLAAIREPLVGVDDQDDPAWPSALPRSGEVADWVKTRSVRVALTDDLSTIVADVDQVERWKPYRVRLAATCQYTRRDGRVAEVTIVHAYSVEDAFGLYSIESPATGRRMLADHMRAETPTGSEFHAWKGRYYVQVRTNVAAEEAGGSLLSRILFVLPDAEPPPILHTFPTRNGAEPVVCLARSAASLIGPGGRSVVLPPPEKVDHLLGQNRDTLMAVAAYRSPESGRSNTVWIVEYETPAEARRAFNRYRPYIETSEDADAAVTMVTEPRGRYLLGTWTAEEESIANLLPGIRHGLPG